jgi:hypothetical protein
MTTDRPSISPMSGTRTERGQIIVIFAFLLMVLLGMAAFVVDLAWIWSNQLQVQRAADAGALAGVVHLPGDPNGGIAAAKAESKKNGFEDTVDGVTIVANPDPSFHRRMIVTVAAPVDTFFMGLFGFDQVTVRRTAKAEYVLPVPMGSPENYYGVFGMTRGLTTTDEVTVTNDVTTRSWSCGSGSTWNAGSGCTARLPTTAPSGSNWTATSGTLADSLNSNNNVYARTTVTGAQQQWSGFGAQSGMPNPGAGETLAIVGLQVRLSDAFINSACSGGNATIGVALSWNGGGTWSTTINAPTSGTLGTNTSNGDYVIGSSTTMSPWGAHPWVRTDFSDANFRVRLTSNESCSGTKTFSVDMVDVRITWDFTTPVTTTTVVETAVPDQLLRGPGTACTTGKAQCYEADGVALNPRGFWGTLNTQGAENVNGDAFQPGYDTRTGGVAPNCSSISVSDPERACYDALNYYNYGVEMPPGSTGGAVYVYDPGFCSVDVDRGTGDRWFGGSAGVSTFYELYNTQGTLADIDDDGPAIANSGASFRNLDAADDTMGGGTNGADCRYHVDNQYGDGRDYHNRWYLLASGLTGGPNGTIYRLHTTSTDPASPGAQLGTNGENSFAVFASASGGAPKVYGIGAMQAFTPLSSTGPTVSSEFYLAQIESVHAGKTVEIHLWDPGDTRPLNAQLQILIPTSSGWTPTTFSYTAQQGTTNAAAAACNASTGSGSSVTTNVGNTNGTYNGCWLTIQAVIPSDYTAEQDGWWKIRYLMTGNGTSNDVTTWTVNIIGNPVHLILP